MTERTPNLGLIAIFALTSLLASCEALRPRDPIEPTISAEQTTLKRPTLPPDSVVFDVLLARVPYQDRDLTNALWNDVDELEIDSATRKRLNEQGFRAGLVGASPPDSLSKILTLKGRELRESIIEEVDPSKVESSSAPVVSSKPITLRAGMKSVIETRVEVGTSIPILENENGTLVGKTYSDARTTLSVSVEQNADGSARFDLAPLLKYGSPKLVARYRHGQLVRSQEQPTKSFDRLKFSISLRPGQFLVMGATDAATNALGKYFFSDGGEDFDQKILVLRLLVTQRDGQFDRFPDFQELIGSASDEESEDTSDREREPFLPEETGGFGDYALDSEEEREESSPGKGEGESRDALEDLDELSSE